MIPNRRLKLGAIFLDQLNYLYQVKTMINKLGACYMLKLEQNMREHPPPKLFNDSLPGVMGDGA